MSEKSADSSTDPSPTKLPVDDVPPEGGKGPKRDQASDFALALLLLGMSGFFSILLFEGAGTIALILAVPGMLFLVRGIVRALRR